MSGKSERTCAFFTFGCKVNQYETQCMREEFKRHGFTEAKKNPKFFIVNGCTVTSIADKKCRNLLVCLQKKNPKSKIIVTGCYAQNHPQMHKSAEEKICLISQDDKAFIAEALIEKFKLDPKKQALPKEGLTKCSQIDKGINGFSGHSRAFVKIQDGCDNFCSYCIVPLMRHKPKSKGEEDIVKEIETLTKRGFKEIVLCGINLGKWGRDLKPAKELSALIEKLNRITDLERLRLSSIELEHVNNSLINQFAKSDKLCAHLHIPLQSGDDKILKMMNRHYTACEYLEKLNQIRQRHEAMSFTTDVIVGFPGESEQQFNNTLKTIRTAGFSRIHVFPFSPRPGTPASDMANMISTRQKKERRKKVLEVAKASSFAFRKKFLNKKIRVLFEEKKNEYWCGYSDEYIYVKMTTEGNLGNAMKTVRIDEVSLTDTIARC